MSEKLLQASFPHLEEPKLQEDGRYSAWCLFHDDGHGKLPHAPDLYVDASGYRCYACGAHGSLRDLAKKLGVEYTEPDRRHTAFEELLGRGIKEETLLHFGVREGESGDLFIPIRDEADAEIATRIRAASGKKLWPRREVDPRRADILTDWERIRTAKTAVLVAGETDFLVTWQAGYPAATFLHGEGTVKPEAV